jgi:hypothetical protein
LVDEVDIAKNADDVSGKNEAITEKFVVDDKEFILSFDQLRKRMFPIRNDNKILKRVYAIIFVKEFLKAVFNSSSEKDLGQQKCPVMHLWFLIAMHSVTMRMNHLTHHS